MRLMKLTRWSLIVMVTFFGLLAQSFGQIGISVQIGPPALPVYDQPICPGDGYLWTPGYWAYDDADGYYWVPGTWIEPPQVGFLWTPGYWGWGGSAFLFHEGYWGSQVGFYGGINYGFGYIGHGYEGGRWDGGHFYYNRSVTNINVTEIHNVYNTRVEVNNVTRVSYNGGNGGVEARATAQEEAAAHERHVAPVAAQTQHMEAARSNPQLRATANHGNPPIAATSRPGELSGHEVVPAKGAPANEARPAVAAVHPKELPPNTRPPAPNTGNPKTDKAYQQQQEKMYAKQDQERQKLQQKQDQQHQQLTKQKADEARTQQVEKQHQQQTQQLQQKHTQQQQTMQQHQQPQHPQEAKPENHKP